jgi:hypothetical protein
MAANSAARERRGSRTTRRTRCTLFRFHTAGMGVERGTGVFAALSAAAELHEEVRSGDAESMAGRLCW